MRNLQEAIRLREQGKLEESRKLLLDLVEQLPASGEVHYQCAWIHDNLGLERDAAVYYEKALVLNLSSEDAKGAFIGLGSTYRTIGEYSKSKETLLKGIEKFPENNIMKVFLSMTLYNLGEHAEAMEHLLTSLVATSHDEEVLKYKKAIGFYAPRLDETW
ncbi:tetratricopeptide repeat protein [Chungangia koreensis]|uniref:Tetratricopeptide repeat protein n=1 Tax=Chungangia koreensis TaxID=752657 RepID=A0ABV8X419_9LACT